MLCVCVCATTSMFIGVRVQTDPGLKISLYKCCGHSDGSIQAGYEWMCVESVFSIIVSYTLVQCPVGIIYQDNTATSWTTRTYDGHWLVLVCVCEVLQQPIITVRPASHQVEELRVCVFNS